MQNNHPISEDIEPPPTGGQRPDTKGYRTSRIPLAHDAVHGRNLILKSCLLKKYRLETGYSSSSRFVPSICGAAAIDSQLGEYAGTFDEDDEYPPSALCSAESRKPAYPDYLISRMSLTWGSSEFRFARDIGTRFTELNQSQPDSGRKRIASLLPPYMRVQTSTFRPGYVSFVSWYRCVPSGRLSPPGIAAC